MLKKLILIILLSRVTLPAISQSQDDLRTPKVIPPSADAAALGKYGQIPVDKSTGIPDISIPIYEIKTPRFTLPISLSYHASGIKVEEMASWVGAGWVLNAGGVITRTISGFPDDGGYGLLTNHSQVKKAANIQWPADIDYISHVVTKTLDTQPDNFFYNFNSHSGSFVFSIDDINPILIPYEPVKITYVTNSSQHYITDFNITDEEGNFYNFSTRETETSSISPNMSGTSSWYLTQIISADLSDTIQFVYSTDISSQQEFTHSFSQDLTDLCNNSITSLQPVVETFSFRIFYPVRISSIIFKGGKVDFIASGGRLDDGNMSLDSVNISNIDYATNKYSLIKSFKLTKDYFNNTPNANDLASTEKNKHRLKLTGLQILNNNRTIISSYQFDYNPTMLPALLSYAQDKWGYYNGKNLNKSLLESQQVTFQATGSSGPQIALIGGSNGADRSTSETYMKAGVLEKITYPTKGYTVFNYEANKLQSTNYISQDFNVTSIGADSVGGTRTSTYTPTNEMLSTGGNVFYIRLSNGNNSYGSPASYVKIMSNGTLLYSATMGDKYDPSVGLQLLPGTQYQITAFTSGTGQANSNSAYAVISTNYKVSNGTIIGDVGGLRISSIKNYNSNGQIINTETYKYGINDESGAGIQLSILTDNHFKRGTACTNQGYTGYTLSLTDTYNNTSFYPLATLDGSPVAYPMVSIYDGDLTQNNGKTIYKYDIYTDSVAPIFQDNADIVKTFPVSWKNGGPKWEGQYRNNDNNQYSLVNGSSNEYSIIGRKPAVGTIIEYRPEPIGDHDACSYFEDPSIININGVNRVFSGAGAFCEWFPTYFAWYDYPFSTGSRALTRNVITRYDTNGTLSLTDTTEYYYDNLDHMFPTRIVTFNGKGDSLVKKISYPQDMVNANMDPTGIYNTMTAKNIIAPQIEITQYKNTTQLKTIKTNYNTFNNLIEPQSVQTTVIGQSIPDPRLYYDNFDNYGNILQFHKASDINQTYIWDYAKSLPIAEIKNANASAVAYTSFESDGQGNWNFAGIPTKDNTIPITGIRYYNLNASNAISKTVNSGTSYIVSYWTKNLAALTVSGSSTPISGRKINGWIYYEHKVSGVSTVTVSGTGKIDELRLYPTGAQMTTYTYSPLIGMTSQTDQNNNITYYEYDGLERLVAIRDGDRNIIKKFGYNYAGQKFVPNHFTNNTQTQTYAKNDCTVPDYSGSEVADTVLAGTYESDSTQEIADSFAIANLQVNGQSHANLIGSCLPMLSLLLANYQRIAGFTITLTAVYDSTKIYTLAFPEDSDSAMSLQKIPQGRYNITISKSGNTDSYVFTVSGPNGEIHINSAQGSWVNVPVNANDFDKISIGSQ